MTYPGARVAGGDYFDDVLGDNQEAGIHKGMGLADYDRVQQQVTPTGVALVQLSCRSCGNHADLEVSWEELFYVANNGPGKPTVLPQGWSRSDKNMSCYIQIRCPSGQCSDGYYAIHFTPDEARDRLRQAADAGFVNPQQAQAWQQKIAMYSGQPRG